MKDGFLINPTVVDARTDVTTRLLSEEGFIVQITDENGDAAEESYEQRQFEKKFFSPETNQLFCKTFLENALRDPVTREIGKSIIFAVSQNHAAKLAQILNEMADRMFPGKYQSDFAVQVTSSVDGAQQHTINFTNNKLLGSANFLDTYVNREVFDKPEEYYTLDKLRRAAAVDRRLTLREILEKIFGLIPRFKSKDELLEEEFAKFIADQKPEEANAIPALKQFFKAYVTNGQVRDIIESKKYTELYTTSAFTTADLKAVPPKYRTLIPDYVKDYVSLNQFVA